jgi:hypothetical protein
VSLISHGADYLELMARWEERDHRYSIGGRRLIELDPETIRAHRMSEARALRRSVDRNRARRRAEWWFPPVGSVIR